MATKKPRTPLPVSPATQPHKPEGADAALLERKPLKTPPPQHYQVVLINDDFTPMEFVVEVLQEYFGKDRSTATQIMMRVHLDGRGVCGVYTHDVARTKVAKVTEKARTAGHPLQCVCEPVA